MKYNIAVVNVVNKKKKYAMNKDLNGGFGTADTYNDTIYEKILGVIKKKAVKLPIISLAFLMGIFKQQDVNAKYYEGVLPTEEPHIILIYGSIIDYKHENYVCRLLKSRFKNSIIGFIGPFPSVMPKLFSDGNFVIVGDFEYYFLKKFNDIKELKGNIIVKEKIELDSLPTPEVKGFPINNYSYFPAITTKPFFALQSSRGCPYSCSYYCVYGKFQGSRVRIRSVENVINDIKYLHKNYEMKGFQFRDPTFGIDNNYVTELCNEIKKLDFKIKWGIETRVDLLTKEKVKIMFDVGLRNINIGIETTDINIANKNKRLLSNINHQEEIIKYSENLGVKISAFYLFGYEGDSKQLMEETLKYAKKLNTFLARFAVCTPYPGTEYYDKVQKEGKLLTDDYEQYTEFNPVMSYDDLKVEDINIMIAKVYKEYYFRVKYILSFIKWRIREFWL